MTLIDLIFEKIIFQENLYISYLLLVTNETEDKKYYKLYFNIDNKTLTYHCFKLIYNNLEYVSDKINNTVLSILNIKINSNINNNTCYKNNVIILKEIANSFKFTIEYLNSSIIKLDLINKISKHFLVYYLIQDKSLNDNNNLLVNDLNIHNSNNLIENNSIIKNSDINYDEITNNLLTFINDKFILLKKSIIDNNIFSNFYVHSYIKTSSNVLCFSVYNKSNDTYIYCNNEGLGSIIDLKTNSVINKIYLNDGRSTTSCCMLLHSDNSILFYNSHNLIFAWNVHLNIKLYVLEGHIHSIKNIIEFNKNMLISGDSTGDIIIWNIQQKKMSFFIKKAHKNWILRLCKIKEDVFVSSSGDCTINIWKHSINKSSNNNNKNNVIDNNCDTKFSKVKALSNNDINTLSSNNIFNLEKNRKSEYSINSNFNLSVDNNQEYFFLKYTIIDNLEPYRLHSIDKLNIFVAGYEEGWMKIYNSEDYSIIYSIKAHEYYIGDIIELNVHNYEKNKTNQINLYNDFNLLDNIDLNKGNDFLSKEDTVLKRVYLCTYSTDGVKIWKLENILCNDNKINTAKNICNKLESINIHNNKLINDSKNLVLNKINTFNYKIDLIKHIYYKHSLTKNSFLRFFVKASNNTYISGGDDTKLIVWKHIKTQL